MKWLSFLAKLAFICNICFLLCLLMRYSTLELDTELNELLIILGWVMAIVVSIFYFIITLVALAKKRYAKAGIPAWLSIINISFMVAEFIYLVYNPEIL